MFAKKEAELRTVQDLSNAIKPSCRLLAPRVDSFLSPDLSPIGQKLEPRIAGNPTSGGVC